LWTVSVYSKAAAVVTKKPVQTVADTAETLAAQLDKAIYNAEEGKKGGQHRF
jgi:hypothetical protein